MLPGLCLALASVFKSWLWYQWLSWGLHTGTILSALVTLGPHGFRTRHTKWGEPPLIYWPITSSLADDGIPSHCRYPMKDHSSINKKVRWAPSRTTTDPTVKITLLEYRKHKKPDNMAPHQKTKQKLDYCSQENQAKYTTTKTSKISKDKTKTAALIPSKQQLLNMTDISSSQLGDWLHSIDKHQKSKIYTAAQHPFLIPGQLSFSCIERLNRWK